MREQRLLDLCGGAEKSAFLPRPFVSPVNGQWDARR